MAVFVVLSAPDVPALGESTHLVGYRGDHADGPTAAAAAADALGLSTGQRVWVIAQSAVTRYVVTASSTHTAAAG